MSARDDLDFRTLGGTGDGTTDDTVAIQTAVNLFVRNPGRWRRIVGVGKSVLKGPIIVANDSPGFNRVEIWGGDAPFADFGTGLGGWVWIRQDAGDGDRLRQPMLILQGCKGGLINGITFIAANTQIYDYAVTAGEGLAVFYNHTYGQLLSASARDNVYSPMTPVAVDPFIGASTTIASGSNGQSLPAPGGVIHVANTASFDSSGVLRVTTNAGVQRVTYAGKTGGMDPTFTGCLLGTGTMATGNAVTGPASPGGAQSNRYPGLEDYYGGDKLNIPRGSTGITFRHCNFMEGVYGVTISSPGSILVQNAEDIVFDKCGWLYNRTAVGIGQSQARCTEFRHAAMVYNWLSFDNRLIGGGAGNAATPTFSGFQNIGGCRYLFNLSTTNGPLFFHDAYCEAIGSLGFVGHGFAVGNSGASIHDVQVLFMTAKLPGGGVATNKPEVQMHLWTWGYAELRNVALGIAGQPDAYMGIGNENGRLFLQKARLYVGARGTAPGTVLCGFENFKDVRAEDVDVLGDDGTESYQERPFGPGEVRLSEVVVDGNLDLTVTQDATNKALGTISVSSTIGIAIGDLLCVRDFSPSASHWRVKHADGTDDPNYDYFGPFGVITNITGTGPYTLTVDHIGEGFPFAVTLKLKRQRWLVQSVQATEYTMSTTVSVGDAVYLRSDGTIARAQANSTSTMPAIGIVVQAELYSGTARVAPLSGDIAGLPGLSQGSTYWVSAMTPGGLETFAPSGVGNVVQMVGIAKSTTTLAAVTDYVVM